MNHPECYSVGEDARRAALLIRGGIRFLRGKDTQKVDRKLDDLAAEAREREAKTRQ